MKQHLRFRGSWLCALLLCAWLALGLQQAASAGGGPENVFLLVNARSEASKTIANHYVRLREIPASNVLYLDWSGDVERVKADAFREQILAPAMAAIQGRGLAEQIDYLIYSSDFPWLVDLSGDFPGQKPPPQLSPSASLTGATYLSQMVAARDPNVVRLDSNHYVQPIDKATKATRSAGFRSWYGWGPEGQLLEAGGQSYLLSTMLGVTSGRGNSVEEVVRYLERSAKADGARPQGTIYYMKNGDVRSKTRDWAFAAAVDELKALGVEAEVIDGVLPTRKLSVQGAMIGTASFNWSSSGSTIAPGAICEHLTSLGGILRKGGGQTPLSEFLRYGAAGACGTVAEPYAIQAKFPLASLHVHYARGCSLAEAFYQSVAGPYQLLIVGDPLCRPWANIPAVSVSGIEANQTLSGKVSLKPTAQVPGGQGVDRFELFVDGRRMGRCAAGEELHFDTRDVIDGHHELRIVAIEASAVESQGRLILPVTVNNRGRTIQLQAPQKQAVSSDEKLSLAARSPGATAIVLLQNGRALAQLQGEGGRLEVDARHLGVGPVTLQAVADGPDRAISKPVRLVVQ